MSQCMDRNASHGRVEHCGLPNGHKGPHRNLYSLWSWANTSNEERREGDSDD